MWLVVDQSVISASPAAFSPHEVWVGRGVVGRRRPNSYLRVFGRGAVFVGSNPPPSPSLFPPLLVCPSAYGPRLEPCRLVVIAL